jgi:DNA-binding CsgD family transcriptional regulator
MQTRRFDNGPVTLTSRQREVLELLARGRTNAEIASELGISLDGAKWHVSEVMARLDVDSRDEAADWWRAQHGLRPRLNRFVRAMVPAAAWAKWSLGAGALVVTAVVVIVVIADWPDSRVPAVGTTTAVAKGSEAATVFVPTATPPTLVVGEPPGPDVTPIPGATPDTSQPWWYVPYLNADRDKPRFDGTLAGIRIGPNVDPGSSCEGGVTSMGTVSDTTGTRFDLELPYQPPQTTRQPGSEYVMLCDGQVVSSEADYTVAADSTGSPFGGSLKVYRHVGDPIASLSIASERWRAGTIATRPAAIAEPILPDIGLGESAVVVYGDGVLTEVHADGIPMDELMKVAESLF